MIHRCNSRCSHGNHYHPSQQISSVPSTKMPNPKNYEVTDIKEIGSHHVLLVKYPGVTTFSGMKCLVVKCSLSDLVKTKTLDPHFYDGKPFNNIEIVARFPPTDTGISNAEKFASSLGVDNKL